MRIIYKASFGLLLTFSFLNVSGQVTIQEPEYTGNIIYIDNGQARPLEKQKASQKTKVGASVYLTGVGKAKASNVVTGSRSTIRIAERDSITFIVRVVDNNIDPFQTINIFKLEQNPNKNTRFIEIASAGTFSMNPNKNTRFIEIASAGTFSGTSANDIAFIPFDAKKYGEKSYIVRIQKQLIPGEYAMTIDGSRELFNMFGVD